ncbi:hypothetical protein BDV38DRAFT_285042 [Aspergillus pseudotamarii]|uniref:Transferase family-domain-containing protein n=1 Tax=Aspergillus pseudotamarii TaxID=132259 RepID=A0A5N6SMW4_ASPPS|nr:uncharacterized protein BDV38DRAFT_285042 [Aspergillus pseudotamarii]KAE8135209.1 hypothetical protein BDV38DRAFT_285042 [Aspergillus pseudotamarii]
MDAIRYFLGMRDRRQPKSTELESDIYPVHLLDDAKCLRGCPSYLFRFNDVLDAKRLSDSLSRLLEIGDWRKLGGRFRRKADGRLEIVVPKQFSVDQPSLTFTHDVFHTSIEDHPLGRRLPKPTKSSSVFPLPSDLRTFAGPGAPVTIKEIIQEQTPLTTLHITSFTDATIVVFSWPHVLMDAMGTRSLLHNWSLVLNGKEEEVSALASAREDIIGTELEKKEQTEDLLNDRKQLGPIRLLLFALRIFFQNISGPRFEERTVFIKGNYFDELKSRAQSEHSHVACCKSEAKNAFISDGDVFAAWAVHMVALSEPGLRSISFYTIINARYRLPVLQRNPREEYIQNLLAASYSNFSREMASGCLGPIARVHRENMSEQTTEEQIWSYLRMQREHIRKRNNYKYNPGDRNATPIIFNNLSKGEILHVVDFTSAVLKQGEADDSRSNPIGTALCFTPMGSRMINQLFGTPYLHVLGKDHAGNYRVTALLRPQMWARIEEELNAF